MKKRKIVIVITVLAAVGYILFFPKNIEQETYIKTEWKTDLSSLSQEDFSGDASAAGVPFFTGDYFGYITDSGKLMYTEKVLSHVAYTKDYFINYSAVSETLILKNREGEIVTSFATRGYPLIKHNRIFIIDEDRCGLAEWDESGAMLWHKRFSLLITAFNCNREQSVIGFINGEFQLLNSRGETVFSELPTGSKHRVIYGAAVSEDSSYIAVFLGVGPQRVILYTKFEDGFRPVYTYQAASDYRRETMLQFSENGRFLFIEQPDALVRLDTKSNKTMQYSTGSSPSSVVYNEQNRLILVRSGTENNEKVNIFTLSGMELADLQFGKAVSFYYTGNALFCAYRNEIIKFDVKTGEGI